MTHLMAALTAGLTLIGAASGPVRAQDQPGWGGAWGYATSPATATVKGELPAGEYRFRIRLSQSGDAVRLRFLNPEGAVPLSIASARIASASSTSGFSPGPAAIPLTFSGAASLTLAGGASLDTDPAVLAAVSGQDVIVSIVIDQPSTTVAGNAGFPLAFAAGDAPAETAFEAQKLRPFVTLVSVRNPSADCTVVTIGDSITEGARGDRPDWRGWPGILASRLISASPDRHCGVVNVGISGNRLLRDGRGTAAVDRFDRDVASVPGATHLIVLEGINDIWRAYQPDEPPIGPEQIIAGYQRLIAAGHAHGLTVIGGTLTPAYGSRLIDRPMDDTRQAVNRWIRSSGAFDAVIDFDLATRDTETPPGLRVLFDSGDRIHPGNAGYEAMGRAVPLDLLQPRP